MKRIIFTAAVLLLSASTPFAQEISNDVIRERIRNAGAAKTITLTYDPEGRTTKIMAVSDNFSKQESREAGLTAMNFAIGLFYPGDVLAKSPESFLLTFWVMSKKPRFGEDHAMTAVLREEMLVIGSARYVAKPAEQMEYLNFEVSRENLAKIGAEGSVRFHLGDVLFTFTPSQMKLLADLLTITEVR
jgi:hypothetical protein